MLHTVALLVNNRVTLFFNTSKWIILNACTLNESRIYIKLDLTQ